MRIIFSIAHVTIGGAQRVCLNLIKWLQERKNVEVLLLIASKKEDGGFKYDLGGINHVYLPKGTLGKIKTIRREVKRYSPDLFVSFGVPNCLFDIPALLGLRVKTIVCERNDPSHFGGSLSTKIISRLLMRMADGYVFQTKDAQQYYGGKMAKQSLVIPNPLFVSFEQEIESSDLVREPIIVTTGRLNKQKNHPLLIKSFKAISEQFTNYKLIIFGEGPERSRDEMLIKELRMEDRIFLPGSIQNVLETIQKASLFVMSSDFEGMPNSLMEAMALGLPCISTDCPCGGPRELINDGANGYLVPVGDVNALSEKMSLVLSNRDIAIAVGKEALKIRDDYSVEKICGLWFVYFEQVCNSN